MEPLNFVNLPYIKLPRFYHVYRPKIYDLTALTLDELLDMLLRQTNELIATVNAYGDELEEWSTEMIEAFDTFVDAINQAIADIIAALPGMIATEVTNQTSNLYSQLTTYIDNSVAGIEQTITNNVTTIINNYETTINTAITNFETAVNNELANYQAQLDQFVIDLNTLQTQVQTIIGIDWDTVIQQIEDIQTIIDSLTNLTQTLADMQAQIDANTGNITTLQGQYNTLNQLVTDNYNSLFALITACQSMCTANSQAISALQVQMATVQGNIVTINGSLSDINSTITNIQNEVINISQNSFAGQQLTVFALNLTWTTGVLGVTLPTALSLNDVDELIFITGDDDQIHLSKVAPAFENLPIVGGN
jgi:chromosome segregation ATPase